MNSGKKKNKKQMGLAATARDLHSGGQPSDVRRIGFRPGAVDSCLYKRLSIASCKIVIHFVLNEPRSVL